MCINKRGVETVDILNRGSGRPSQQYIQQRHALYLKYTNTKHIISVCVLTNERTLALCLPVWEEIVQISI